MESLSLTELKEAMERHFLPKKLVVAERFTMMTNVQKQRKTLQEYFAANNAEVQKAANECAFEKVEDVRDARVTMVFIGGLASVDTRKRLLEKEQLAAKEALETAEAFERVGKDAPYLKEDNKRWEIVRLVVTGRKKREGARMPHGMRSFRAVCRGWARSD